MVIVIYGTTGELIKLIPLLRGLEDRKIPHKSIGLVQQQVQLARFFDDYQDVQKPDYWIVKGWRGKDLSKIYQMPLWIFKATIALLHIRKKIKKLADKNKANNYVVVHGDTMTTVLGAIFGRLIGFRVAHIEAGLRSFNLFHPFPEELDRIIVSKIARIHFSPGDIPVSNLNKAKAKGKIINTGINTVYDSINFALKIKPAQEITNLPAKFGIISIHRNELLTQKSLFVRTIKLLAAESKKTPLVFLKHPLTYEKLKKLGLEEIAKKSFIFVEKLDYFSFVNVLKNADFAITDSGGLQEECAYLGIPCMVHRMTTERMEGLDSGVIQLSHYDDRKLTKFVTGAKRKGEKLKVKKSPTSIILNYFETNLTQHR